MACFLRALLVVALAAVAPSCVAFHHRAFSIGVLPGRVIDEDEAPRAVVELVRPRGRPPGAYEVIFSAAPGEPMVLQRLVVALEGDPSDRAIGRQVTMLGSHLDGPRAPRPGEFWPMEVLGPGEGGEIDAGYPPEYRYFTSTVGLRHDERAGELVGYRWSQSEERWTEVGSLPLDFERPSIVRQALGWTTAPLAYRTDAVGVGLVAIRPLFLVVAYFGLPIALIAA